MADPRQRAPLEATDPDKEFFACLAIRHTPGIGPKTWARILDHYSGAYDAIKDAEAWPGLKLASARQSAAAAGETWRPSAQAEYRAAKSLGLEALTWFDHRYPRLLKQIPDPPIMIYAKGDMSLLANPCVALVGSRRCGREGLLAAQTMAQGLSRHGLTVVSGMAQGIDRQAHLGALSGPGSTIAVMGTGMDEVYPAIHDDLFDAVARNGLVVTEFGPGTGPHAANFPQRNRIISGLSLAVVVAEATKKSGSLITARLALDQGRDVFSMPGPSGSKRFEGGNRLIKQGAALVENAEDVIARLKTLLSAELAGQAVDFPPYPGPVDVTSDRLLDVPGPDSPESVPPAESGTVHDRDTSPPSANEAPRQELPELDPLQNEILRFLERDGQSHADELSQALETDSGTMSSALIKLEMMGLVRRLPGMYYERA